MIEPPKRYRIIYAYITHTYTYITSLVAQTVKHLATKWMTQVQSLGREDLQVKEMATHSSILAWRIPWPEEPDGLQSMGSQRIGCDWATSLSLSFIYNKMPLNYIYITSSSFSFSFSFFFIPFSADTTLDQVFSKSVMFDSFRPQRL